MKPVELTSNLPQQVPGQFPFDQGAGNKPQFTPTVTGQQQIFDNTPANFIDNPGKSRLVLNCTTVWNLINSDCKVFKRSALRSSLIQYMAQFDRLVVGL